MPLNPASPVNPRAWVWEGSNVRAQRPPKASPRLFQGVADMRSRRDEPLRPCNSPPGTRIQNNAVLAGGWCPKDNAVQLLVRGELVGPAKAARASLQSRGESYAKETDRSGRCWPGFHRRFRSIQRHRPLGVADATFFDVVKFPNAVTRDLATPPAFPPTLPFSVWGAEAWATA